MASRIYVVIDSNTNKTRMVEAASSGQAIKYCCKDNMKSKAATAKDVAYLMGTGCTIENTVDHEKEAPQVES